MKNSLKFDYLFGLYSTLKTQCFFIEEGLATEIKTYTTSMQIFRSCNEHLIQNEELFVSFPLYLTENEKEEYKKIKEPLNQLYFILLFLPAMGKYNSTYSVFNSF